MFGLEEDDVLLSEILLISLISMRCVLCGVGEGFFAWFFLSELVINNVCFECLIM